MNWCELLIGTIKVCLCDLVKWLVVRVSTDDGSGSE